MPSSYGFLGPGLLILNSSKVKLTSPKAVKPKPVSPKSLSLNLKPSTHKPDLTIVDPMEFRIRCCFVSGLFTFWGS